MRAGRFAAVLGAALFASPAALAHGFGQRFVLPLPLWLWVVGAGLTVVLTFVVLAVFVRDRRIAGLYPRVELMEAARSEFVAGLGAAFFVAVVLAGFLGVQDAYSNILTTFVWVVWWVGVAFVCALAGNVWALVNPFDTLFRWAERAAGGRLSLELPYPRWLAAWPAVGLFFVFAWAELIWASNDLPRNLAAAVTAYAILTWFAMFVFGRRVWLANGEFFSLAFGVLARFAPLAVETRAGTTRLVLRPFGAGLLAAEDLPVSFVVFVLLMLSTVTFDGFLETPAFQAVTNVLYGSRSIANLLFQAADVGISDLQIIKTVALVSFPLLFVGAYWLASAAMARLGEATPRRVSEVACAFVLTLVPIAVAYHLAHYVSLLLTSGQLLIPLLSDPFGWGWNLLGTRGYEVNIGILNPYALWYGATVVIVIGHVVAVYLAHVVAVREFGDRRAAMLSQVPMVALMVLYTISSLWILAQPIVG